MNPRPVALVTGAAGILGPAICQTLREKGWQVAGSDLSDGAFERARSLRGAGFCDFEVAGEIADPAFCEAFVQNVEGKLGDIGLVVNNAAIPGRGGLATITEDQALQIFRVNTLAPLWLTRASRGSLVRCRGSVINISSAHTRGFSEENHLYVASKAALEHLTRSLASEFLGTGVRVNAIRVGRVPGPAFLRKWTDELPPEAAREMCEQIMPIHIEVAREALGEDHIGAPEAIASIIAFLASEEARFVNGQILTADGGFLVQPRDWDGLHVPESDRAEKAAEAWMAKWRASCKSNG